MVFTEYDTVLPELESTLTSAFVMQHDFRHDSGGRVGTIDVDDTAVLDKVLPKVELGGLELIVELDGLGFLVVSKLVLAAIDVEAPVVSDVGTVGPRLDPEDTGGLNVVLLIVVWVCEEG